MHVDLPSGHWVEITPVSGLKAKHRDAHDGAPRFYIKFDEDGKPDTSDLPISATIATLQRDALMATLISSWSFTTDDGVTLPVPHWDGEVTQGREAFGEIGLDDWDCLLGVLEPYLAKVRRKPDPKGTTTASSTGISRDKASSPKG